jgi:multiple sugar transport system ATP-binding protein
VARLRFQDVSKRFDQTVAVDHLDLEVLDGELLVLLGPSGCGKTTALRMIAGLEEVTSGSVWIGDRVVNDVEPRDRDVAMVFQSYALYPHMTVAKNIEFPLSQRGVVKAERARRVQETADALGLGPLLDRRPGQLSGGQRQRVALARAIVRSPQAFLMDEPLSNLDATLRTQTRADIVTLQQRLGTTTLYVTHDQVEAMTMGNRIAVMSAGVLQQVGPPQEIYDEPANVFVAGFIGSPGMNLLPGDLEPAPGTRVVRIETGTVPLPPGADVSAGKVVVGCRPEALSLDPEGTFTATVSIVELLGSEVHVVARAGETRVVVRQDLGLPRPAIGESVRVCADPAAIHLFDAVSGARLWGPAPRAGA